MSRCWVPCRIWGWPRRSATPRRARSGSGWAARCSSLRCTAPAPGQEHQLAGPAQPRPGRGGHRHRGRVPHVSGVRHGRAALRVPVHRGAGADAGYVDAEPSGFRWAFLAGARRGDGTQALPEAVPADLVRRQPPNALRRAVRLADGFIGAGSTTTADFVEQARMVREALGEKGRDPATFRVAKRVYLGVDDDARRASSAPVMCSTSSTGTSGSRASSGSGWLVARATWLRSWPRWRRPGPG